MKTKIFYLLLIVAITIGACKKEKLTSETQTGTNTFSCKINGKIYKAKNDLLLKGLTVVLFNGNAPDTYDIGIEAVMYSGDDSDYTVSIDLFGVKREEEYSFINTIHRARQN